MLEADVPAVLAHRCDWLDGSVIAVHNFSKHTLEVGLDVGDTAGVEGLSDVFSDADYDALDPGHATLKVGGYGYRWIRAERPSSPTLLS